MCISVLDSYLESYQHHLKTVSDISVDDSNNNVSCCESDILTYSFDDIIKEFCDKLDVEVIASVDAISFYDGWLNLIEFKNILVQEERPNLDLNVNLMTPFVILSE